MTHSRRVITTVLSLLTAMIAADNAVAIARLPNVLLILVDDLGYGELGCQGNSEIPTPNIDSIAKNGVRCTSGYVTASYCSPSRAGLLTGRYQTRFGHELNPVGKHNLDPKAGLPITETTIANPRFWCASGTPLRARGSQRSQNSARSAGGTCSAMCRSKRDAVCPSSGTACR